jgi:hypothetical protein
VKVRGAVPRKRRKNQQNRGFGVSNHERLIPPPEELDTQRQRLRQFPPYATHELLAAAHKRESIKLTLDEAITLVHEERTNSQLTQLIEQLGLDPAAPDCWRDGFIRLAKLHHNVGRLIHRWTRKHNNAAEWTIAEQIELLWRVADFQRQGKSEREAVELVARGKLRARRIPGRHASSKSRFRAFWQKYMRLKRRQKANTRWQYNPDNPHASEFIRSLFLLEFPGVEHLLRGNFR